VITKSDGARLMILFPIALIWAEIRTLYSEGLMEYITDLWNIVDYVSNTFYVAWIFLRFTAMFTVWVRFFLNILTLYFNDN
jgi:transient receptor potential cation channel subfamily C member 4